MDLVELWKQEQLAHWQSVAAEIHWPGNCPECNRPLNDSAIRHGWVTVQVGFDQARVHTVCRAKFNARSLTEQKALNRDRNC